MSSPKEKAKSLFKRYYKLTHPSQSMAEAHETAKQCALIAINREIESFMLINLRCTFDDYMKPILEEEISELQQIEAEIENI